MSEWWLSGGLTSDLSWGVEVGVSEWWFNV